MASSSKGKGSVKTIGWAKHLRPICKISSRIGMTRRAGAKGGSASQKTLTN